MVNSSRNSSKKELGPYYYCDKCLVFSEFFDIDKDDKNKRLCIRCGDEVLEKKGND